MILIFQCWLPKKYFWGKLFLYFLALCDNWMKVFFCQLQMMLVSQFYISFTRLIKKFFRSWKCKENILRLFDDCFQLSTLQLFTGYWITFQQTGVSTRIDVFVNIWTFLSGIENKHRLFIQVLSQNEIREDICSSWSQKKHVWMTLSCFFIPDFDYICR